MDLSNGYINMGGWNWDLKDILSRLSTRINSLEEEVTTLNVVTNTLKPEPTYFRCPAQLELFPSYGFEEDAMR